MQTEDESEDLDLLSARKTYRRSDAGKDNLTTTIVASQNQPRPRDNLSAVGNEGLSTPLGRPNASIAGISLTAAPLDHTTVQSATPLAVDQHSATAHLSGYGIGAFGDMTLTTFEGGDLFATGMDPTLGTLGEFDMDAVRLHCSSLSITH